MLDIMEIRLFIVLATILTPIAHAHSWIEELMLIAPNGSFTGVPGYPRGMVQRTAGFEDNMMVWQLPQDSNSIPANATMCKPSQQTVNYTDGSPMLSAPAGSSIALRYQENGHVTMPWSPPGKPQNSGAVYVYGTDKSSPNDTLEGIYQQWTLDGTGGDGRGRLLTSQFFDDGQCYQINPYPISVERQQQFPRKPEAGSVEGADLWCQTDVKLPSDLKSGTSYTLYWVWDWSTMNTSSSRATPQFYTTCMDVSISDSNGNQENASFAQITNYGEAAISSIFESLTATAAVTVPTSLTAGNFVSQTPDTATSLTSVTSMPAVQTAGETTQTAAQQSTQCSCVTTSTITVTATSTSTVATTVSLQTTEAITSTVPTTLQPNNQSVEMARRRPLR